MPLIIKIVELRIAQEKRHRSLAAMAPKRSRRSSVAAVKVDAPALKRKRASAQEEVAPPAAKRPAVRRKTGPAALKAAVEPLPAVEHHSHGTVRGEQRMCTIVSLSLA